MHYSAPSETFSQLVAISMVLDLLGTLLSLLSTWYFIKVDRKAWLISIFATAINSVLYFQKGIFADTALELFYLSNSLYGFFLWGRNSTSADSIRRLSLTQTIKLLFLILALYSFIYFLLGQYTPSTVASLDALTCSLSIMGQWLMCYKVIFTWVIWFFTDAIYAYLYFHKQIPFHALLMLLYTIMAVLGYLTWSSYDVRLNQTKILT